MLTTIVILSLLVLIYFIIEYSFLIPDKQGLTILMYHKVSTDYSDGLTISEKKLYEQLSFLKENYEILSFSDLIRKQESNENISKKSVIITFDDAYQNNLSYMYPLLERLNLKVTIFLPSEYLGKTNEWDNGNDLIMDFNTLKSINSKYVEFGLHSHSHQNFRYMSINEIETDIKKNITVLHENGLMAIPVIAYPYGGFPRDKKDYYTFRETLKNLGIKMGLRIGNRINKLPIQDGYLLTRVDINGSDTFWRFKRKLKKGRIKLFA